jgi:hypothetical protein
LRRYARERSRLHLAVNAGSTISHGASPGEQRRRCCCRGSSGRAACGHRQRDLLLFRRRHLHRGVPGAQPAAADAGGRRAQGRCGCGQAQGGGRSGAVGAAAASAPRHRWARGWAGRMAVSGCPGRARRCAGAGGRGPHARGSSCRPASAERASLRPPGTYTAPGGYTYTGQWVDDRMHGEGRFTFPSGAAYAGQWAGGVYEGRGAYAWPDGRRYEVRRGGPALVPRSACPPHWPARAR